MTTFQSHSIDKFMASVLPEFQEFVENVYRNPFKNKIDRIYDTNKNDFSSIVELSERYIVKEYCIDIMGKDSISKRVYNHTHLGEALGVIGIKSHSDMILEDIDDFILKCLLKINNLILYGKIKFTIDNYCNIYIPRVKLYILNNHSKYNLYSFYVLQNTIFNLNKYLLIDMLELERNKIFQIFGLSKTQEYNDEYKRLHKSINNTLPKEKRSNKYVKILISPYLEKLSLKYLIKYLHVFLNAIKYKDMVNSLKPYIELSNKFKSQYNEITKESNEIVDGSEITKEIEIVEESNKILDDSKIIKEANDIKIDKESDEMSEESNENESEEDIEITEGENYNKIDNSEKTDDEIKLNKIFNLVNELINKKSNEINRLTKINNEKEEKYLKITTKYNNNIKHLDKIIKLMY